MKMRKLLALVLAVMMVMSLATSAFAASITIDDGTITGATYQAYKILNATDGGDGKYAYTVNIKYADVLKTVTGKTADIEVYEYIKEVEDIAAFAEAVYDAIVAAGLEKDYESQENAFAEVDQGYYLIVETVLGSTETGATDTYSLLMLDTAGNESITVKTKEDLPTVDKQVEEKNDSTGESSWGEAADHDIGDVINYSITGTVSDKYASYKSYYYSFTDTMDPGLTYNEDAKVYVVNGETKTEVTEQFVITVLENGFTATSNLKELTGVTVTEDSQIVVEYTCTLNEEAVIGGDGNLNKVYLSYENNPYHDADGDKNPTTPNEPDVPGKTPEDICVVFTFKTVVNKVDDKGNALAGAGFTLYKWSAEANDWVQIGEEITGETTFTFAGLDVGKYKLVESTVPAGYNKAEEIEFEIVAEYTEIAGTNGDKELTGLAVKDAEGNIVSVDDEETEENEATFGVVIPEGTVSTSVVNKSGVELPSTGGIGTTIFYAIGGILVLAAVVLLVTKKRMAN